MVVPVAGGGMDPLYSTYAGSRTVVRHVAHATLSGRGSGLWSLSNVVATGVC